MCFGNFHRKSNNQVGLWLRIAEGERSKAVALDQTERSVVAHGREEVSEAEHAAWKEIVGSRRRWEVRSQQL